MSAMSETKVREALGAFLTAIVLAMFIPWGDILGSIRDSLISLVPDGPLAWFFIIAIGVIFLLLFLRIVFDDADNISSSFSDLISSLLPKR